MRAAALAALLLTPTPALACATCISTPYQSSTWPYLGLILLPFGLIVAIAGILCYQAGYRPSSLRRLVARYAPKDDSQIIKETI